MSAPDACCLCFQNQHYIAAVEHVMTPLSERVAPIYPSKVWEDMRCDLLYSLSYPVFPRNFSLRFAMVTCDVRTLYGSFLAVICSVGAKLLVDLGFGLRDFYKFSIVLSMQYTHAYACMHACMHAYSPPPNCMFKSILAVLFTDIVSI